MTPQREDIALYVMDDYDGDPAELERAIATDPAVAKMLADEAELETLLRDAAAAATFCAGCHDLVRGERCDACGVAVRPGGYVVEDVLVRNAHGRMYVARDADGKRVALKELAFVHTPSLDAVAAFEREAKLLRALEHPRIPRFCASFEEGHGFHVRYYIAQELVDGTALDARLADHFYAEAEIVDIARQVLEVLVYLQGVSPIVIHRDVKPANLLMRPDGTIALVDLGAAHIQGTTAGSTTIGTFGYMPIEQLAGVVDATTDTYALGASLVHLLTRREPWRVALGSRLDGVNVSPAIRTFLEKLVAPEPGDRYATAADAKAALEDAVTAKAKPEPTAMVLALDAPRPPSSRRRRAVMLAGALVAIGGSIAAGYGIHALTSSSHAVPAPTVEQPHEVSLPASVGQLEELRDTACRCSNRACLDRVLAEQRALLGGSDAPILVKQPAAKQLEGCIAKTLFDLDASAAPPPATVPAGEKVDLSFVGTPLHDVLRTIAEPCKLNVVIPDSIDAKVDIQTKAVPCDQALEVVLETHGLWYAYSPDARLVRVAPRKQLQLEREEQVRRDRLGIVDPALPAGKTVDLDFRDAPLAMLMKMFADAGGINVVVPEYIDAKVTIRARKVPWQVAFQQVLASEGLWYRYRPGGNIASIATRKQLDIEAEEKLRPR